MKELLTRNVENFTKTTDCYWKQMFCDIFGIEKHKNIIIPYISSVTKWSEQSVERFRKLEGAMSALICWAAASCHIFLAFSVFLWVWKVIFLVPVEQLCLWQPVTTRLHAVCINLKKQVHHASVDMLYDTIRTMNIFRAEIQTGCEHIRRLTTRI